MIRAQGLAVERKRDGEAVRATAPTANLNRPSTVRGAPEQGGPRVRSGESRVTTEPGEAGLTSTHQAVLNAALFLEGVGFRSPGVPQLALTAGLSPTGGYWRQIIGRLRSAGFVEPRGTSLTPAGRAQAVAEPLGGTEDVQARVRAVLPSSTHQAVYDLLLAAYPEGLSQDDDRLPKGGYGRQIVGRLRSLGVARKGWPLTAAPFLFLEYDLGAA